MTRINPLYLALLLIAVLLVVIIKLDQARVLQQSAKQDLRATEAMALRIDSLKREWENAAQTKAELIRLVNSGPLRGKGVHQKVKGGVMQISAKSVAPNDLEYLLNKIMNGSYSVKKLEIRRQDAHHAACEMEIAL